VVQGGSVAKQGKGSKKMGWESILIAERHQAPFPGLFFAVSPRTSSPLAEISDPVARKDQLVVPREDGGLGSKEHTRAD
jgi:hypothetical protein